MTISAKVLARSRPRNGWAKDLFTFELRYPRAIHAEFMTHRVFSRNASSSRAVPVQRMIQDVMDDPFIPLVWGSNQPGMQAGEEQTRAVNVGPLFRFQHQFFAPREEAWLEARNMAVEAAKAFAEAGYHKQIVNRLLEPFSHIKVVATACDLGNFFSLRLTSQAEPHMYQLAMSMLEAANNTDPQELDEGQWHLPYITAQDIHDATDYLRNEVKINSTQSRIENLLKRISAARCARVSYNLHDGKPTTIQQDLELADRLLADKHMSPFEHQATPDSKIPGEASWYRPWQHGNLPGWIQHRKIIEHA